jgi:hypothetical protein
MVREEIAEIPDVISVPGVPIRERVVVRKRRSRRTHRSRQWSARASRKRAIRTFVICAAVLLLMAAGVYLGLARQDVSPVEGSLAPPPSAASPAVVPS